MGRKIKYFLAAVFFAGLGLGFGAVLSFAFNGPGQSPPSGSGAVGADTANDVSFGTSTTDLSSKVLIAGSSTLAGDYALKVKNVNGSVLFSVANNGAVNIGISGAAVGINGNLTANGSAAFGAVSVSGNTTLNGVAYGWPSGAGQPGQMLTFNAGNLLSWTTPPGAVGGGITGTGAANYLAKFSGSTSITTSTIYDNGTSVGIGTALPNEKLEISGNLRVDGTRIKNSSGYGMFEANATDWLRVNPDSSYPATAIYNPVAIGTGGLAVGEWTQQSSGVLKVVNSAYLATGSGNVGIGTAAPGQKLDVVGGYIRSNTGFCINGSCITSWPSGGGGDTGVSCPAGQFLTSINITNGNVSGGNCAQPTYQ